MAMYLEDDIEGKMFHMLFDLWDSGDLRYSTDPETFVDLVEAHLNYQYQIALDIAISREDKLMRNYKDLIKALKERIDPDSV